MMINVSSCRLSNAYHEPSTVQATTFLPRRSNHPHVSKGSQAQKPLAARQAHKGWSQESSLVGCGSQIRFPPQTQ